VSYLPTYKGTHWGWSARF